MFKFKPKKSLAKEPSTPPSPRRSSIASLRRIDKQPPPRRSSSVQFSEPIVSDICDLPGLSLDEKAKLYYDSDEIREFRKKYGGRRVRFEKTFLVKEFTRPKYSQEEKRKLYFSSEEVRGFENDFIQSLGSTNSNRTRSSAESTTGTGIVRVNRDDTKDGDYNVSHAILVIQSRRLREMTDATCCSSKYASFAAGLYQSQLKAKAGGRGGKPKRHSSRALAA